MLYKASNTGLSSSSHCMGFYFNKVHGLGLYPTPNAPWRAAFHNRKDFEGLLYYEQMNTRGLPPLVYRTLKGRCEPWNG